MKRLFLIAVLFLALICPNWTMAQPSASDAKPSLLVPKVIVVGDSQISEITISDIRQTLINKLGSSGLYSIVNAATESSCSEYYSKQRVCIEDNIELGRKLGTSYILLVTLEVNPASNKMLISAQIANLKVYDDFKKAEETVSNNSQDIAAACKRLVDKLCPNSVKPEAYVKVEVMPTFQGGDLMTFRKWISANMHYPQAALSKGISGTVLVSFVVETDGSISEINVLRSPDQLLSDEVIRVIKLAPKWQPGRQRGELVRVKYCIPVMFAN